VGVAGKEMGYLLPMTLHLDTNTLIWFTEGSDRLGSRAQQKILDGIACEEIEVSAFVFWELAMLVNKKRIALKSSITKLRLKLLNQGLREVSLCGEIAILANQLPYLHSDPADRIIVASALHQGATLVTADAALLAYPHPQFRKYDAAL
jgi:PIN domain nuclease of toxin-antitoxin system